MLCTSSPSYIFIIMPSTLIGSLVHAGLKNSTRFSNLRHQMGLLHITKFTNLHIMDPHYVSCEDIVKILQYSVLGICQIDKDSSHK